MIRITSSQLVLVAAVAIAAASSFALENGYLTDSAHANATAPMLQEGVAVPANEPAVSNGYAAVRVPSINDIPLEQLCRAPASADLPFETNC